MHAFRRDLERSLTMPPAFPGSVRFESRVKSAQRQGGKAVRCRDQLGVRVIYTPSGCDHLAYAISDRVMELFAGVDLTKDYIARPKPDTHYRSLHLEVPYIGGTQMELQVRDEAMHLRATCDGYHIR